MTSVHVYYTCFQPGYVGCGLGSHCNPPDKPRQRNCDCLLHWGRIKEKSFLQLLKKEMDLTFQLRCPDSNLGHLTTVTEPYSEVLALTSFQYRTSLVHMMLAELYHLFVVYPSSICSSVIHSIPLIHPSLFTHQFYLSIQSYPSTPILLSFIYPFIHPSIHHYLDINPIHLPINYNSSIPFSHRFGQQYLVSPLQLPLCSIVYVYFHCPEKYVPWNTSLSSKTPASQQWSKSNTGILTSQCNGWLLTGLFRSEADSLLWSGIVSVNIRKLKIQTMNQYLAEYQTKEPSVLNEAAHCPEGRVPGWVKFWVEVRGQGAGSASCLAPLVFQLFWSGLGRWRLQLFLCFRKWDGVGRLAPHL